MGSELEQWSHIAELGNRTDIHTSAIASIVSLGVQKAIKTSPLFMLSSFLSIYSSVTLSESLHEHLRILGLTC